MATVLTEEERSILGRQRNGLTPTKAKSGLVIKYFTWTDRGIIVLSVICATIAGVLNPLIPVRIRCKAAADCIPNGD